MQFQDTILEKQVKLYQQTRKCNEAAYEAKIMTLKKMY